MRYTVKQFRKEYPNDDACLDSIFENRYGGIEFCPKCAAKTTFYRVTNRKCYACMHCAYQLHPLADTIFHKSRTPLTDWFYAIYLFSVSKNGVSAKELERHLGVTYKTAHRMARQIRKLMAEDDDSMLEGQVEADETYVGGKTRDKDGRFKNKTAILGATERYGRMKTKVVDSASATTAIPFIRASLKTGATLYTDDSRIYSRVKREYRHETVNHSRNEYARCEVTTNSIESFWSQLKRSINGTYHCISPQYLQMYVDEFTFRYNYRGVSLCPLLLEQASKPF